MGITCMPLVAAVYFTQSKEPFQLVQMDFKVGQSWRGELPEVEFWGQYHTYAQCSWIIFAPTLRKSKRAPIRIAWPVLPPIPWPHSSQAWTPAGLPIAPTQTTETTANGLCSPEPAELCSVLRVNGQDMKKPWNTNHYYSTAKAVML